VFLIDVDSIRKINETLGASAGNEVLVTLATRLKTSVRAADSVLRIGDDEFAVVMGEICLPRDLHYCAGKILQPLLHPIPAIGRSIEVDCSMGVSVYPDCASSVEELVVRADAAKQSAKQRGKNEVEFFISSPARPVNSPRAAPILSVPAATLANEQGAAPSPVEVAME
jgi:diguanylate cyclase (GGDEF)-like protein